MVGSRPNQEESVGSQRHDHFVNLERRRDREVSVHTTHTNRSHSWTGSHLSNGENTRNLQPEIDHLQRKLCCKQRRESPSSSGSSFDGDSNYRPRLRTPPSESFFFIIKSIIISEGVGAQPTGAWEMMLSIRLCTKSQSPYLHGRLRGQNFLDSSHSQLLPCTMEGQTRWSV